MLIIFYSIYRTIIDRNKLLQKLKVYGIEGTELNSF